MNIHARLCTTEVWPAFHIKSPFALLRCPWETLLKAEGGSLHSSHLSLVWLHCALLAHFSALIDVPFLQAVTLGDVNGDGELEVVFGTNSGYLYAVSGKTGRDIPNFPFRTHGQIMASVLITQLTQGLSQQLVVMSFDGHLYMVDGITGMDAKQVF